MYENECGEESLAGKKQLLQKGSTEDGAERQRRAASVEEGLVCMRKKEELRGEEGLA